MANGQGGKRVGAGRKKELINLPKPLSDLKRKKLIADYAVNHSYSETGNEWRIGERSQKDS